MLLEWNDEYVDSKFVPEIYIFFSPCINWTCFVNPNETFVEFIMIKDIQVAILR